MLSTGPMLAIMISMALTFFAIAIALIYLSDGSVRRRLSVAGGRRDASESVSTSGFSWLIRVGERLQESGNNEKSAREIGELRMQLIRAGIYSEQAVPAYGAIRILLALSLGFAASLVLIVFRVDSALLGAILVTACAASGMFAPPALLKMRARERALAVRFALPDAIDLLVVCVEAGSSLTQALQRVASELKQAHPVICEQLQITLLEMQAGASRGEALRHLSERIPDDRLRSFLTLVIQSDQLGAGLAHTLRVFATELRTSRLIEAEHKAAELPVKMAVPLVFFIFPCLLGIIFTPIIIRFIRVLFQAGV